MAETPKYGPIEQAERCARWLKRAAYTAWGLVIIFDVAGPLCPQLFAPLEVIGGVAFAVGLIFEILAGAERK